MIAGPTIWSLMVCFRLFCLVAFVTSVGCAPRVEYRLRFLDAVTQQPVEGVAVRGILDGSHYGSRFHPASGHDVVEARSAVDGSLSLNLLTQKDYYYYYVFANRQGYQFIHGTLYTSQVESFLRHTDFDVRLSGASQKGSQIAVREVQRFHLKPGEEVVVPMQRRALGGKSPDPAQ